MAILGLSSFVIHFSIQTQNAIDEKRILYSTHKVNLHYWLFYQLRRPISFMGIKFVHKKQHCVGE